MTEIKITHKPDSQEKHSKVKPSGLDGLLRFGLVSLYCYRGSMPDVLVSKEGGGVMIFSRSDRLDLHTKPQNVRTAPYSGVSDVSSSDADVCFLDGEALKALVPPLPARARYVLARFAIRPDWGWGLIGLLHRILKKQVKIRGIINLPTNQKSSRWLVLEKRQEHHFGPVFISTEVGASGFLDYLRKENVNYVVLRSYENLPEVKEGDDLDILVADEDEEKIKMFAKKHPGLLRVDTYGVSSAGSDGLPYYPPALSEQILRSAVDGPGGSRIPGPREAFLSLVYHVLYHKGTVAGVPSRTTNIKVNPKPNNDYAGVLRKMSGAINLDVNIIMEDLDEYLARESWRPMRDTLTKIADRNEWVRERFFSAKPVKEIGLGTFILRKSPHNREFMNDVLQEAKKGKFIVVRQKVLDDEEQANAIRHLRGGNWTEKQGLNRDGAFLPYAAIVVLDLHLIHKGDEIEDVTGYSRLRTLKEKLRSRFDVHGISLIHSTDNTQEAWEYIETIFGEEAEKVRQEVDKLYRDFRMLPTARVTLYLKALPYYRKKAILKLKKFIVRHAIK